MTLEPGDLVFTAACGGLRIAHQRPLRLKERARILSSPILLPLNVAANLRILVPVERGHVCVFMEVYIQIIADIADDKWRWRLSAF